MRIPILIKCHNCGRQQDIFIRLDSNQLRGQCPCGEEIIAILAQVFIGYKVLQRSRYEFQANSDYSLSIVFAAMAVECDLARLFNKWTKLEAIPTHKWPTEEELEERWRLIGNVRLRMDTTARLMYPEGLTAFVKTNPDFRGDISLGYPRLDLDDLEASFQKEIFWPRNRILHHGYVDYSKEDATRIYNTASLALMILEHLDRHRRAAP